MNVIRAAMPRLRAAWRACVQCVVDPGLRWRGRGWGAYSAAKFALGGLTEALAVEAAPHGVRVTLVYRARRACRPGRAYPYPGLAGPVRATASVPGPGRLRSGAHQDPIGAARVGALARDVDRHRSARRAPPGRVRRGEGDAGRQDASTPTAWQAALLALGMARASQALENLVDAQQRQARHEAQLEDARRQPAAQPLSQSHAQ